MSVRKLTFTSVIPKEQTREHLKTVETGLNDHKNFIDGEVKVLQGLRSSFTAFRQSQKSMNNEVDTKKTQFRSLRKMMEERVQTVAGEKASLEMDKENQAREIVDVQDKLETGNENVRETSI